ncbi:MAG: SDR family NAD(P)-dependent oxidoreductase [Deltaproteobacteria bacterium]
MTRVAAVTGGAGGIGEAVVFRLAEEGCLPIIIDQNEAVTRQLVAELRAREVKASSLVIDVTQAKAVREAFAKIVTDLGRIDVLVNVAGGTLHKHAVEDFPLAHWQATIDANLTSTFLCSQAVIGAMKSQRSGTIINISSAIGFTGAVNRSAYAAAKAGIVGFSKALALEVAPHGIRVNVVAPGRTATKRVVAGYSADEWQAADRVNPLGRAAAPKDIADAVAFLAGGTSGYMTGQTLHVNGGRLMP